MAEQVTCKDYSTSYDKPNHLLKHSIIHEIQSKTENDQNDQKHCINLNQEEINKGNLNKCESCGNKFRKKGNLNVHIKTVHENVKKHKCGSCDKSFGHKETLKNHVNIIHENMKAFKCDTCSIAFGYIRRLKEHIKSVHENIRVHKCVHCGKIFGYKKKRVS